MPLKRGVIYHSITYDTAIIVAEIESDIRIKIDTPYLTLTGKLWAVYFEDLGENWLRYNGTAVYVVLGLSILTLFMQILDKIGGEKSPLYVWNILHDFI